MSTIEQLDAPTARQLLPGLTDLLIDAVADGASVGFLHPLSAAEAAAYWAEVCAEMERGGRLLFAARDGDRVLGCVQLALADRPNAAHRAEVQKLLVHTAVRRRGLGAALMFALEEEAAARGRHLLVLDTRAGDAAGRLYEKLGYVRAGVIPGYARSSSGRLHGTAMYYRDLRDADAHLFGDTDARPRWGPEPML
ncbi:MAG TPA: GNAT family N-acetyltransferase [Gemmataceae bacterium]|nr:GNAT family N-acetyltransferase [Gemmataceae bacterium]